MDRCKDQILQQDSAWDIKTNTAPASRLLCSPYGGRWLSCCEAKRQAELHAGHSPAAPHNGLMAGEWCNFGEDELLCERSLYVAAAAGRRLCLRAR